MSEMELLAQTDGLEFMRKVVEALDLSLETAAFELCEDPETSEVEVEGETFSIQQAYSEGGHEGAGEYVVYVFSFSKNGEVIAYIRDTGRYDSYGGTEMDGDWTTVQPVEVTVTRYVAPGEKPRV